MREIVLTQGKVALVDDEDFYLANQFKWFAHYDGTNWYAKRYLGKRGGKDSYELLHQFLAPENRLTDHVDGNGLNNQRLNLRLATHAQNLANQKKQRRKTTSRFKGVYWKKQSEQWVTQIGFGGARIHLGYYENETDAAHVYDYAARIYFGEFARLNFP